MNAAEQFWREHAERVNRLFDLDFLTSTAVAYAQSLVSEHKPDVPPEGSPKEAWIGFKYTMPPEIKAARLVLSFHDQMRECLESGDAEKAAAYALKLGANAALLEMPELDSLIAENEEMKSKLSRSNTEIVELIRAMRTEGRTAGDIALKLNAAGHRTRNGTEFTDKNVNRYRQTHKIP